MQKIISSIAVAALIAVPAMAAAQSNTLGTDVSASIKTNVSAAGVSVSANADADAHAGAIGKAQDRANEEITRRVSKLTGLSTRISAAAHISASDKTSLSSGIASQISALQALQGQIAADSSTSSVRADVQSITKSYRIYALVVPQASITAAADRVNGVSAMMTTLSAKIRTRLAASPSASASAALTDMQAKIADAQAQSSAAVSEVLSLKPDNGDATVMASNTATLKDGRSKVQAAQQDLVAARKDVTTILAALKAGESASASASAGAEASTSAQ